MSQEELKRLKKDAAKNPPRELRGIIMDGSESKVKKSSTSILLEMRYSQPR